MDEYKSKLVEQISEELKKDSSFNATDICKKFKLGSDYSKELFTIVKAIEAGTYQEEISTVSNLATLRPQIVLTSDQEAIILHAWNVDKVETIKEITHRVFGSDFDGRTNEAKAIKRFLAGRQLRARGTHESPPSKTSKIAFTDTQLEFIRNHSTLLSPLEITQSLFSNPNLTALSAEARAIRAYLEEVSPETIKVTKSASEHRDVTDLYRPPKTMNELINRINEYIAEKFDIAKLNPRQKHNLNCLIHYLKVHRFQMVMNEFVDERDREMMESSFIRWLYDKGDLTEEEIDLYINWVLDIVNHSKMYRELNKLIAFRDSVMEEKKVMSKPLVDQINKLYEEIDANQKRQKTAQNDLSGKRRDRVANAGNHKQSVVQLIEAFKDHKKRELILQFAESRKKTVKNEMDRLDTMDDLKFELFGATKEELLHGL